MVKLMIGKIKREEIPKNIVDVLGCTNKEIINTIILDILNHSMGKPYIKMSEDVFLALSDLKTFNYQHIYQYSMTEKDKETYKKGMYKIYRRYLEDIERENHESVIYRFLEAQDSSYLENTSSKRMVIDFIAGMTDEMFLREIGL